MAELLEAMMVLSFGISWPASIIKSYRARTAKGKRQKPVLFMHDFVRLCLRYCLEDDRICKNGRDKISGVFLCSQFHYGFC